MTEQNDTLETEAVIENETKTTAKKSSTTKKTKSKTSTKTKKASTENVEKKIEKRRNKEFKQDTPILCRSVRQNNLSYTSHSGVEYRWSGFGDEREVPYGDILSLKARKSAYLYEPWFLIMDEDLMEQPAFKKDFGKINEIYKQFDDPETFFDLPIDEIRETLQNAPRGLKEFVIYNAGQFIKDGSLDRLGVINALDEMFGTQLRMMI